MALANNPTSGAPLSVGLQTVDLPKLSFAYETLKKALTVLLQTRDDTGTNSGVGRRSFTRAEIRWIGVLSLGPTLEENRLTPSQKDVFEPAKWGIINSEGLRTAIFDVVVSPNPTFNGTPKTVNRSKVIALFEAHRTAFLGTEEQQQISAVSGLTASTSTSRPTVHGLVLPPPPPPEPIKRLSSAKPDAEGVFQVTLRPHLTCRFKIVYLNPETSNGVVAKLQCLDPLPTNFKPCLEQNSWYELENGSIPAQPERKFLKFKGIEQSSSMKVFEILPDGSLAWRTELVFPAHAYRRFNR